MTMRDGIRRNRAALLLPMTMLAMIGGPAAAANRGHPGCEALDARACLDRAIDAMGGGTALGAINGVTLDILDHTALTEQSYRQAPFLTSYDRIAETIDFRAGRVVQEEKSWWPEADPGTEAAESSATLIASDRAAIVRSGGETQPGSLAEIEDARETLALGPERLLLTARAAPDLHFEDAETVRATPHSVLAFRWDGHPVRLLLNASNHLPDAVETVRTFDDFWYAWGDVHQRVYYDNWKLIGPILYPTNRIDERNGIILNSAQALDVRIDPPIDSQAAAVDPAAAARSMQARGWDRPFDDSRHVALAPGVDLYRGSWNVTTIRQQDGVLLLEAPISPGFAAGAIAKARAGGRLKAVLSTSDSWPHVAGVREAVADRLPVYILDLNRPLLDHMIAAPHALRPDHLQRDPARPKWIPVSARTAIGEGDNRIELYPLRGAATERQYMVYFPARRLLYASDTVVYDPKTAKLYDPELTHEVVQAVEREHLRVDTVYAMHQPPTPWRSILRAVDGAMGIGDPSQPPRGRS